MPAVIGAGDYIGSAIAKRFAREGYLVFAGRRSAGSLTWGGLANSYYWIDPVKKVTGVWATQLLPFYDARAVAAFEDFERAIYASL